jgi:phage gpG-like protein
MSRIQNKFDFTKILYSFNSKKNNGFELGDESLKFFKKGFTKQGWEDVVLEKWKKRKKPKPKHPILVKSGNLKRSIAILQNTSYKIILGTNVPYAKIHNEGFDGVENVKAHTRTRNIKANIRGGGVFINGKFSKGKLKKVKIIGATGKVKAHTRNMVMPQRQFMGHSTQLSYLQIKRITKNIDSCFK